MERSSEWHELCKRIVLGSRRLPEVRQEGTEGQDSQASEPSLVPAAAAVRKVAAGEETDVVSATTETLSRVWHSREFTVWSLAQSFRLKHHRRMMRLKRIHGFSAHSDPGGAHSKVVAVAQGLQAIGVHGSTQSFTNVEEEAARSELVSSRLLEGKYTAASRALAGGLSDEMMKRITEFVGDYTELLSEEFKRKVLRAPRKLTDQELR